MRKRHLVMPLCGLLLVAPLSACGGTGSSSSGGGSKSVTIYSADGLGDWYKKQFAEFTKETGVKVNYVESGSGEVVSRALKERSNPQADVLVTLPPFIQQSAAKGLLQKTTADLSVVPAKLRDPKGQYAAMMNNYFTMIRNTSTKPAPTTWSELTEPKYKNKIQYSTPGQAGDGTAMLVLLQHVLGKQPALDYLKSLQTNNVGPSSSTGKLGPKVSTGALKVANSDLQMATMAVQNDKVGYQTFIPADAHGKRTTLSLPYDIGLAAKAPHADNGNKLITFLLSKKVQQAMPADAMGFPSRSDVTPTDANYKTLQAELKGVTVWNPDWDAFLGSMDGDLAAYNTATGQS